MDIEYAKTPQWANTEKTLITLLVKFKSVDQEASFAASPDDVEEHGRDLFKRAAQGEFGTIQECAPTAQPIPQSVSIRQAKLALLHTGHYEKAEQLINGMSGVEGVAARIEWNAPNVERNSAFVETMGDALGISSEGLDNLFIYADTL